ncbi:MAG: hypothetical protein ACKVP5_17285 [Aestuariivirga sp.]
MPLLTYERAHPMSKAVTQISRFLSLILRYEPEAVGLWFGEGG